MLSKRTKHMAKDGQVYFYRELFVNFVKPQRCTTESVGLLDGSNKDVSGAKLLLTNISVYPVDCAFSVPTEDIAPLSASWLHACSNST